MGSCEEGTLGAKPTRELPVSAPRVWEKGRVEKGRKGFPVTARPRVSHDRTRPRVQLDFCLDDLYLTCSMWPVLSMITQWRDLICTTSSPCNGHERRWFRVHALVHIVPACLPGCACWSLWGVWVSLSLSLSPSLPPSLCLSVCLSVCVCVSVGLSVGHAVCVCVCVCV